MENLNPSCTRQSKIFILVTRPCVATASIGVVAGIPWLLPVEVEIEKEIGSTTNRILKNLG